MNKEYWIQLGYEMNPVRVELSQEQVNGIIKLFETIVNEGEGEDFLVITDSDDEEIYNSYTEYSKGVER